METIIVMIIMRTIELRNDTKSIVVWTTRINLILLIVTIVEVSFNNRKSYRKHNGSNNKNNNSNKNDL